MLNKGDAVISGGEGLGVDCSLLLLDFTKFRVKLILWTSWGSELEVDLRWVIGRAGPLTAPHLETFRYVLVGLYFYLGSAQRPPLRQRYPQGHQCSKGFFQRVANTLFLDVVQVVSKSLKAHFTQCVSAYILGAFPIHSLEARCLDLIRLKLKRQQKTSKSVRGSSPNNALSNNATFFRTETGLSYEYNLNILRSRMSVLNFNFRVRFWLIVDQLFELFEWYG